MTFFSKFLSIVLAASLLFPLQAQISVPGLQMRLLQDNLQATTGSTDGDGFVIEVTDAAGKAVVGAAVNVHLPEDGATGIFPDGTRSAVAYTNTSGRAQIRGILWGASSGVVPIRITASSGIAHAGMLVEETLSRAPVKIALPAPQPAVSIQSTPARANPLSAQPAIASVPKDSSPSVSITGTTEPTTHGFGKKKWIIVALIAAGAVGGIAAFAGKSKSSGSATPNSSLSIGSPTISVGAP